MQSFKFCIWVGLFKLSVFSDSLRFISICVLENFSFWIIGILLEGGWYVSDNSLNSCFCSVSFWGIVIDLLFSVFASYKELLFQFEFEFNKLLSLSTWEALFKGFSLNDIFWISIVCSYNWIGFLLWLIFGLLEWINLSQSEQYKPLHIWHSNWAILIWHLWQITIFKFFYYLCIQ